MAFKAVALLAVLIIAVNAQYKTQPSCGGIDVAIAIDTTSSNANNYAISLVQTLSANFGNKFRFFGVWGSPTAQTSISGWSTSASEWSAWRNSALGGATAFDKNTFVKINEKFANETVAPSKRIVFLVGWNAGYSFPNQYGAIVAGSRILKENTAVPTEVIVIDYAGYTDTLPNVASPNQYWYFPSTGRTGPAQALQRFFTDRMFVNNRCYIAGYPTRVGTFDGSSYPFPGVGDFFLYKSVNYEVQVRMENCFSSDVPTGATCLRQIAIGNDRFVFEPAQGILFVTENSPRRISGCYGFGSSSGCVNEISVPGSSANMLYLSINYGSLNVDVWFSKDAPGFARVTENDLTNFGNTGGLCGVWDGCAAADLYGADQEFSYVGEVSNIYNQFAESWRIPYSWGSPLENKYDDYYDYPILKESMNPAFTPVLSTTYTQAAIENCAVFSGVSNYFYDICLESESNGAAHVRSMSLQTLVAECTEYCNESPEDRSLEIQINAAFCEKQCRVPSDVSFFGDYALNAVGPQNEIYDYISVYSDDWSANFYTPIGGVYTFTMFNGYCQDETDVTTEVQVNCGYSPSVNAGDDRVVSRGTYGWPTVYLNGAASDANPDFLRYRWEFVSWPNDVSTNTTYLQAPRGSVSNPSLENDHTLYPYFTPQYPGEYVLVLSVFDGCSFSNDTVTITVKCDECKVSVSASQFGDIIPYMNTAVNSFTSDVSTYSYFYGTVSEWYLESNSDNYIMKPSYSGSSKVYDLVDRTYEVFAGSNTTTSNTPAGPSASNSTTTTLNGDFSIVRQEGFRVTTTTTTSNVYREDETLYYSSIPNDIPRCQVGFTFYPGDSAVRLLNDYAYTNPIETPRNCLGDYVARVDAVEDFNTCGGRATQQVPFTVRCGARPRAHLTQCATLVRFDYGTNTFPTLNLNAGDSTDRDTGAADLWYLYESSRAAAITYPGSCTTVVGNARRNCNTAFLRPTEEGDYRVTLTVSDTCSNDNDTIVFTTVCGTITPVFSLPATYSDDSTPFNQVSLSATSSTITNGTISYRWQAFDAAGNQVLNTNTENTTLTFSARGGLYTVNLRIGDGCGFRYLNRTVDFTCTQPISAQVTVTPATQEYDPAAGFALVTLDGTASTVATGRAIYTWRVVSQPLGSTINTAGWNTNNPTFTPTRVGVYQFELTVSDGCKTVTSAVVSHTVTCPAVATPTASADQGTYTLDMPVATTVPVALTNSVVATGFVGTWTVYNSNGAVVFGPSNAANPTWNAGLVGTFTANFTVRLAANVGCTQIASAATTFSINCGRSTTINTFPAQTVGFAKNKFPRVQFDTVLVSTDNAYPSYNYLGMGTWEFTRAPVGSVFAPTNTSSTTITVLQNTTSSGYTPVVGVPNLWFKTRTLRVQTSVSVVSSFVTLDNSADASNRYSACFNPDKAGEYELTYRTRDFCGQWISQTATVIANCNGAPVAVASTNYQISGSSYPVAFNRNGYNAVLLDSKRSTDPDGDSLYPTWRIVSAPAGSSLNTSFTPSTLTTTSFTPDRAGRYVFSLTVSDGCSESMTLITFDVTCSSGARADRPVITYNSDGFSPISTTHFTLSASPRCDFNNHWELTKYVPSPRNNYAPVVPENVSAASSLTVSVFAVFCLVLALLL